VNKDVLGQRDPYCFENQLNCCKGNSMTLMTIPDYEAENSQPCHLTIFPALYTYFTITSHNPHNRYFYHRSCVLWRSTDLIHYHILTPQNTVAYYLIINSFPDNSTIRVLTAEQWISHNARSYRYALSSVTITTDCDGT